MWYACTHVHVHVGMCVYMCEYVQRSEAGSECIYCSPLCFFRQSLTQNLEHMDSVRLAAQQVPGIFMLHRWDYRHMLLCQAFSSFPYLYTIKYDHIYPHFLPSNLLFSPSLSPKFKLPFFS